MSDTLHEVLARGIDKGLRDVGAELSGCTPATLTGHVIRELQAAGLHPGAARVQIEEAAGLLAEFVDDEPCEFDHHGGCQTHGFYEPRPGERCHVVRTREWLARNAAATPRPEEQR